MSDLKPIQIPTDASMNQERFALICKALGHPVRVRILEHLLKVDRCICGQIVDIFPLAQSTVSQHLKVLKEAGLIRGEVEGPAMCYGVDQDVLGGFKKMAAEL